AQARFNPSNVETRALSKDGHYVLNGRKVVVLGAPECQWLLVSARTAGSSRDSQGISVFLFPRDTPGVQILPYRCVDGTAAGDVMLSDVCVDREDLLGEPDQAFPAIEQALDEAICAVCGEAMGAMSALIEKCVEFSKSRQAFGKPIAEFQVIG